MGERLSMHFLWWMYRNFTLLLHLSGKKFKHETQTCRNWSPGKILYMYVVSLDDVG